MKRLKPHPHVIKLLGCVTETGGLVLLCLFGAWKIFGVVSTYIATHIHLSDDRIKRETAVTKFYTRF